MAYDGSLKFDTKIDSNGFSSGVSKLKSTAMAAISAIGAAFATGAIAKALVAQIALVEQYGSAINDQAQKIGITTKAYQELSYIFEQTGGNVDMLQMGIKTLSSAVVDGNKAFEQLGISLDEARKMSQEDLFNTVIDRLASMEQGTLRTSLATDLFGRSATELAPLLNMGADGIAKMRQEAASYGLIMTGEAVAATDKYGDAVTLAQKSGEALRNAMVGKLLPTLTNVALGFADIASEATDAFNERGIAGVVDMITDKFPVATAAVSGLTAAFATLLIIKTLTPLVVAFQTAQVQVALAMMGTTAAAVAESGALTLTEVIVGIFTGQLKGATAATALFNATLAANPVMLAVIAIGALVGALVLASKKFDELNPEIAQTREELKALNKEIESSADAFSKSILSTDKQRSRFDGLIDKLAELSAAYSGSNIEQAQMQSICDSLNSSVDGLSVTFDAQTGKLSQTTQAMHDLVTAQYDAAKASAALTRYQEVLGEQIDAEFEKRKAQAEWEKYFDPITGISRATGASKYSFGTRAAEIAAESNLEKANKTLAKTTENTKIYGDYMAELKVEYQGNTESADETTEATEDYNAALEQTAEAQERVILGGEDVTQVLEDTGTTADAAAARLDNFTGAATNMFERISTKSKLTVKQMIANLNANATALEEWGDNITYLGSILPEDLLQPLIDQGPEMMAGVVEALANATPEEFTALIDAFAKGGDAAKQAWLGSLGAGTDTPAKGRVSDQSTAQYGSKKDFINDLLGAPAQEIASSTVLSDASTTAVENSKEAMTQAVTDSDFGEVGKEITSAATENLNGARQLFYDSGRYLMMGFIIGMLSRKAEIEADARMLAQAASDAFHDALILGSPSKLTYQYGVFFAKGFSNALYDQKSNVKLGAGNLALASLSGFRSKLLLPSGAAIYGSSAAERAATAQTVSGGTTVNAPITVQGVVESDAQLSRRITKQFTEVVVYGRA